MAGCFEYTDTVCCFTDATGKRIQVYASRKHGLDEDGNQIAPSVVINDAYGELVDTTGGVVTVGECPIIQPTVEWFPLCDVVVDSVSGDVVSRTKFYRRCLTTFDQSTIEPTTTFSDFGEDKQTPYVFVGEAKECEDPAIYETTRTPFCTTDDPREPKYLVGYSDGTTEVLDIVDGEDNWCECDCDC